MKSRTKPVKAGPAISVTEYQRRRRQVMRFVGKGAIVIVPAAPERIRNNDATYPYRQDSDFHYLSGFSEPEAVLALVPGRAAAETIMFCRERDPEREIWDGARLGQEGAVAELGMDDAFPISDIDDILPGLIEGRERVYYHFGRDTEFDMKVIGWINQVRSQVRKGARPPHEFSDLGHLLHDMRLYKSRSEVRAMRRAAQISAAAHVRAMQTVRPGQFEHQVEAELLHQFRSAGTVPAYEAIVGGGANACVLHYRANNAQLQDGDLLLIDAGAEYQCYASDITRTFPVNGRYTREQRIIYDIVLAAQKAAIAQARVGNNWMDPHHAAVRVITEGLLSIGLLKGDLETLLRDEACKPYYMHKTGHWLGLDVHDVGDYRVDGEYRELEAGMVMTMEPGIYIAPNAPGVHKRWRGIGVRIEDDILVSKDGPVVLSEGVPSDADEIEALMAEARG